MVNGRDAALHASIRPWSLGLESGGARHRGAFYGGPPTASSPVESIPSRLRGIERPDERIVRTGHLGFRGLNRQLYPLRTVAIPLMEEDFDQGLVYHTSPSSQVNTCSQRIPGEAWRIPWQKHSTLPARLVACARDVRTLETCRCIRPYWRTSRSPTKGTCCLRHPPSGRHRRPDRAVRLAVHSERQGRCGRVPLVPEGVGGRRSDHCPQR